METLLPAAAQLDGLHAAAFVPKPRVSSQPNLLANDGDLLCSGGGYSTHPLGREPERSASRSPRARSSPHTGSVVDEEDDSPATAEHRARLARSSPDTGSVVDEEDNSPAAAEHLARLALRFQVEANRYQLCLSHLADTSDEAVALRRENDQLRFDNGELVRRIATLGGQHSSAIALADEFRRLTLAEEQARAMPPPPPPPPAPPVMRPVPAAMPKSISVRSTGYLKMNPSGKHRGPETNNAGSQRVFVGLDGGGVKGQEKNGAEKEQGAGGVEFEVYNQGMFKTELCNKWEETGACQYGDHCQFAHGIAELRPVIRHPRYKTEVCRMVLAGILCPYGHRCHFRHSITPADTHLLHR